MLAYYQEVHAPEGNALGEGDNPEFQSGEDAPKQRAE